MVFLMVLFFLINSANAADNLESQQSIQQKTDADNNLGGRFSIYGDLGGKIIHAVWLFWAASNIGTLTTTMKNMMH